MLIADAELIGGHRASVRIVGSRIVAIGDLVRDPDEPVIEARGALLLPGLHDHHIHVAALAASLSSVRCGPPEVTNADQLARALRRPGTGWLRGVGYHESVAGMLDRQALDAMVANRPVRVQHRSGRMWFFNGAALDRLLAAGPPPPGLERIDGVPTGRLFDEDSWLRTALDDVPPSFAAVGRLLAARGVTGLTEISPANDRVMARHFGEERRSGNLPQHVLLAGKLDLTLQDCGDALRLGPAKLHLHEATLPSFDDAVAFIAAAHAALRPVAVHCVTEVELVFTLAALAAAGARAGDRIEHAGIAPDSAVAEIARMGLAVVSQPHFIAERGDAYLEAVEPASRKHLYRLGAFRDAGVTLAAGSDAPFGSADPWEAMDAAVRRRTRGNRQIGLHEALTPEQALSLYLADPERLDRQRRIAPSAPADLCLIDRPWAQAREDLGRVQVRGTWIDGRQVFDAVDQSPGQRGGGADPAP